VLILELLRYFATPQAPGGADRVVAALANAAEGPIRWALDAGLGPLLYGAARASPGRLTAAVHDRLLSADLTAQVRHGERVDAATDVIELCVDAAVPVTLLKGISISEQHYPAGHLRPMTDLDVLVPADAYASIEAILLRRGYRHGADTLGDDPHHGVPLIHPKRGVWLELHTALFHRGSTLRRNCAFSPDHIGAQSIDSTFCGLPVKRLTDELQLVYVASYWTQDLCAYRMHPSFVAPLFDAVRLLGLPQRTLDWAGLLGWLDNETARASLYLLLAYLSRRGVAAIPSAVLTRLAAGQNLVAGPELRVIHALLDRHLVAGRPFKLFNSWHFWANLLEPGSHVAKVLKLPWNILFPPSYPHRYSLRRQLQRMSQLARRLG
jgi:hypothetical protein